MTRYEVLERIGAGRMAELFRGKAIAAGGFEKPVAIKRILPHLSSDPRFVELLIAEAKILSVLRHRNVVQIFDVGVGDDGHHFLVMELVDGVDLGALQRHLEKRGQRLPIDLVLHVGAEVCEALDHAQHAAGPDGAPLRLIHRDVTPTNVLVSRAGEVKLTDFGLAKRPEDGTSAGGLRGRFGYVSPEQASGMPVDGRADVFAVGVIMWELALGRRLYSGMPDFEALRAVREAPVARLRELDPSLPAELDTILAAALARDPRERTTGAGELGKQLRGLRYSLDDSSGDPAAALGRLALAAAAAPAPGPSDRVEASTARASGKSRKPPSTGGFDGAEPTVLRIRTADGFGDDREGTGLAEARRVLDDFEEEQTRMSRLPFEEISTAAGSSRARSNRDSIDLPTVTAPPMHLPRDSGEILATPPPPEHEAPHRPPPEDLDDPPLEQRRPRAGRAGTRGDQRTGRTPAPASIPPPVPPRAPPARTGAPPPTPPARAATSSSSLDPRAAPSMSSPSMSAPSMSAPSMSSPSMSSPSMSSPSMSSPSMSAPGGPAAPAYPRPMSQPAFAFGGGAPIPNRIGTMTSRPVVGFGRYVPRRWWPILVAALVIALLSFLITRAALEPSAPPGAAPRTTDAGLATDAAAESAAVAPRVDAAPVPVDAAPPVDAGLDAAALDDAAAALAPDDGGAPLDDAGAAAPLDDAGPLDDAAIAPPADAAPAAKPAPVRKKPPIRKPVRKKPPRKRRR